MRRYTDCRARTGTPRPRHFVRCGIMERDVIIWIILDISCRYIYIHIGLSGWVHIGGRGIRLSYKLQAHFFFYFGKLQQCSGDLETVGGPCSSIGIRSLSVASTRELLLYFVLWFGKTDASRLGYW